MTKTKAIAFSMIFTFSGLLGLISSILKIHSDLQEKLFEVGYTYTPPFTKHELIMIGILILSTLFLSTGVPMLAISLKDNDIISEKNNTVILNIISINVTALVVLPLVVLLIVNYTHAL